MPKYKVTTDQGVFEVDLDREPDSPEQLQSLVTSHLSGGGQATTPASPAVAPAEEKTLAGFGASLPGKAFKFGEDIVQGATALPSAAYQLTKEAFSLGGPKPATEAVAQGVADLPSYLGRRYGGGQQILDTLYNDPFGFMADVSTVLGGVGGVAKLGGMAKLASGLKKASAVSDPLAYIGKAVRSGAQAARLPEKLYTSALNPRGTIEAGEQVVARGLKEELPVTRGGAQTAKERIKDLTQQVDTKVAAINVPPTDQLDIVARARAEVAPEFTGINKAADLEAMDAALLEHLRGHYKPQGSSAKELLDIKRASYKDPRLKKAYERELVQEYPKTETHLAITREIKEELHRLDPDLSLLDERSHELIDLKKEMLAAVKAHRKSSMFNIGTGTAGVVGGVAGGPGGAAALIGLRYMLKHPGFKSKLAIALNKAQKLKSSSLTKLSTLERVGETE